jgi:hypothetical protein
VSRKASDGLVADDTVRAMFNGARDGTANDAIKRHLCRVALAECCVADDGHPSGTRYPTPAERMLARERLTEAWCDAHR